MRILRHRPTLAALAAVAAAALTGPAALAAAPSPATSRSASPGPGCRPSTPAVAYRPGHPAPLGPQPEGAPVPCLVATGFGGAESQVAVTGDGTVVYEPAIVTPGLLGTGFATGAPGPRLSTQLSPGGLSLSSDGGAGWSFDRPAGATWVPQDDAVYVDRRTGRIFFYALAADPVPAGGSVPLQHQLPAGYAHLMASGDDGRSWSEAAVPGFVESENPRFTSGPPPPGQPRPTGYPDLTYWCGNDTVNLGAPVPTYRACYRSPDGGRSWQFASVLASSPVPQHRACGTSGETLTPDDPNYPEAAPDGSLYAEINCGSATFLARSTDEGGTWPLLTTAGGTPVAVPADGELRVGSDGTLFLVYQPSATAIALRLSTDGGHTWSPAEQLTPAGTGPITQWAVAERGPGTLAVSYLGQRGSSADYDGYLIWTPAAAGPDPLLWVAALNPPARPMRTSAPGAGRDDYIGVDVAPDGTPWAGFPASCPGPVAGSPACAGQDPNPEANEAVAGRLALQP